MPYAALRASSSRGGHPRSHALVATLVLLCSMATLLLALPALGASGAGGLDELVSAWRELPADPREASAAIGWDALRALIEPLGDPDAREHLVGAGFPGANMLHVGCFGASVEGRPLYSLRLAHDAPGAREPFRVLLVARQHGNEPAGTDALVFLARRYLEEPARLPAHVELLLIPMLNPDGAVEDSRRNANDVDLNRDHLTLRAEETRALHRLAQSFAPHAAVDLHEFTRDSRDYLEEGFGEWPIAMLGATNHPLLPLALRSAALDVIDQVEPKLGARGHAFMRYHVGGPPPEDEQRPSTLEADDARNGLGLHGALSFIIETGVRRSAEDPGADIGERADAALTIVAHLVESTSRHDAWRVLARFAREAPMPAYLPTNVFWGALLDPPGAQASPLGGPAETRYPVAGLEDGARVELPAPRLAHHIVVKGVAPTPAGYAFLPAAGEEAQRLLDAHGLPYVSIEAPRRWRAERVRLLRVEEEYDETHARYGGRRIVERLEPAELTLPEGTLVVLLAPPHARRAAALLDPAMLYGHAWEALDDEGTMPVLRLFESLGEGAAARERAAGQESR